MKEQTNKMEEIFEQTMLYDFYGELLTEHQKQIYEDVVLNDMSLTEVAESYEISRQAVSDLMKRIHKNYRSIILINAGLIALGVTGIIQPTTSALLHNTSTLVIGLKSMQNLID